jgi:hypothetical protein
MGFSEALARVQAIIADDSSQQSPTEPSEGTTGHQTGSTNDPNAPWQPWADKAGTQSETGNEPVLPDEEQRLRMSQLIKQTTTNPRTHTIYQEVMTIKN